MVLTVLGAVDLAVLIATAVLGLTALVGWAKRDAATVPPVKIVAHAAIQVVSIALWAVFVATGLVGLAWAVFGVITAGQVAGELLAYARFRARHPEVTRPRYFQVVGDGMKLPAPAFHAWVGAVGWFGMLAICIAASVG